MNDDEPRLRVVGGGAPTPAEAVALTVAVKLIADRANAAVAPDRQSRWNDRSRALRRPLPRGRSWAWADR